MGGAIMKDVLTLAVDLPRTDNVQSATLTAPSSPSPEKHPEMLHIPDTLADWPWPRRVNPHYEEVGEQSRQWLRSFHAFPSGVQSAFDACDFNLLASLAYPRLNKDHVRICCDVMNVFFVIEEYTDEATTDDTAKVAAMVMDALRNPHTPRSEDEKKTCLAGEIVRQFWANAVRTASQSAQTRFIAAFAGYTQSVVREAEDRSKDRDKDSATPHTIDSYLQLRGATIGCWPSFALLGVATEDLTDRVLDHPLVDALGRLATELILIGNDLVSYNRERKDGALHNLVSIVLNRPPSTHAYISTPQQAVDWVCEYHGILAKRYLRVYAAIKARLAMVEPGVPTPTPGIDFTPYEKEKAALLDYIEGLGNWVRANDQWSFESVRYFGTSGPRVQKCRLVKLSPLGKHA